MVAADQKGRESFDSCRLQATSELFSMKTADGKVSPSEKNLHLHRDDAVDIELELHFQEADSTLRSSGKRADALAAHSAQQEIVTYSQRGKRQATTSSSHSHLCKCEVLHQ